MSVLPREAHYIRLEPFEDNYYIQYNRIDKEGFKGSRGIEVGHSLASVLSKFPCEKNSRCEKGEKYLYGTLDGSNGVVCYDQKGKAKEVNYYYSDDNIGSYYLHFDIQNDKISLIVLGVITI